MQHVAQSVKIWLKAASLETDVNAKKRVLRKGELFVYAAMFHKLTRPHSTRICPELCPIMERNCQS